MPLAPEAGIRLRAAAVTWRTRPSSPFTAWSLSGVLFIVPLDLATALFAVGSQQARVTAKKLRLSLWLSLAAGAAGIALLGLGAHLVLSVFGAAYVSQATVPLLLMLAGYLPTVPKLHHMAVCLTDRQPRRAAVVVLAVAAAAELAAAAVGGAYGGLTGLCAGLVAVFTAEGVVTAPRVIRVAAGRR